MSIIRLLFLYVLIFNTLSYGNEFIRSEELSYIAVTNQELIEDANSIYEYVSMINGKNITTKGYLKLGRDDISTKLQLPIDKKDYKLFPKMSYDSVIYIYASQSNISDCSINLNDYNRKISVTGKSLNNVVATLNVAKEKLEKHKTSFTGASFRFIILVIAIIIFVGALYFAFYKFSQKHYYLFLWTLIILSQFALYGLEWTEYFPGFKSSINDETLLERFSPLLSLIGVLLAILTPLLKKTTNKNN